MKLISTSALAKERGIDSKQLFQDLKSRGWIYKKDDQWNLTKEGKMAGGEMKYNPKYGEYVVWPNNMDLNKEIRSNETLSSTKIGQEFGISAQRTNVILAELGWIEKSNIGGWELTKYGKRNGGFEMEAQNGSPYVIWDKRILQNKSVLNSIDAATGKSYDDSAMNSAKPVYETDEFRKKHEAKYRTQDGHRVRSRAEAMIDDYLYSNGVAHAYERRLPGIDEEVISDFYIPAGKVFIEFWGMEDNEKYKERKKRKLEIYADNNFNLIEMNDKDIEAIDDVLPRKLKKFGVNII
ncbi:hypothetical protein POV27_08485 [Aureisphaera galaxeae]|uniref:hypothetical protein n=1 Tax=Aureisphaera galaxeae TaxID=1538023 RepID=UPI0023506CA5|nr:hypothetical protein [Aureisphaera galaxeae]MDC8004088.1 hypothetical protein [Aureisphaera galaxeae]